MSRLGKTPLKLPKGVEVKIKEGEVEVKGPKGILTSKIPHGIKVSVADGVVKVQLEEKKLEKSFHGLHRNLIKNAIEGVSQGFEKKLSLVGVGYRAALKGDAVELQLGFSNPVLVKIPNGIKIAIDKGTAISVTGIDKQLVGQFAATIRAVRPPEPYKGKGVRYEDEYVRKKEGKTAKAK